MGNNRLDADIGQPQRVVTGDGNDTITTGAADDILRTGAGNDTLITGGGYDSIRFAGGDKSINAGDGGGTISGGGNRSGDRPDDPLGNINIAGYATYSATGGWQVDARGDRVFVTLGGDATNVNLYARNKAVLEATGFGTRVNASISAPRVTLTSSYARVRATISDKISSFITTGPRDDVIRTGRGADTVNSGGGNDTVYGNAGNDSLTGGDGHDVLVGGAGNDTLQGDAGDDRLYAGVANATFVPLALNVLNGGDGTDRYQRESDSDRLTGIEGIIRR